MSKILSFQHAINISKLTDDLLYILFFLFSLRNVATYFALTSHLSLDQSHAVRDDIPDWTAQVSTAGPAQALHQPQAYSL